jgi:hypothetical protein
MNTIIAQEPPAAISVQPAPAQASDFTSQFPGLPGLFMTGTPPQVSAAPPKSTAPAVAPKSVIAPVSAVDAAPSSLDSIMSSEAASSVEADADTAPYKFSIPAKQSVASSGQATPKHPFNQSRYDSNDDSVIIHVSDEEDSEIEDLEEDQEVAPAPAPNAPAPKSAVPVTKPGPLRNFPAPSISANASAPSTPGATTPGGSAYERKMQEINEMHRRIAEMQKQPRKVKAKPLSPTIPSTTSVAPTSSATNALPGLTSVTNNASVGTDIATQPVEQQQQQMEAKLAQLEEEAETISEQRQAASQTSLPTAAQQASGVPDADSTTSSDDDDDDAMDLSSGDEREPDETADDNEPSEADMDLDSDDAPVPSHAVSANELATMSDSGSDSSDSSDSSTDSEGEDSEDDYEPAPAVPDVAGVDALPISTDPVSQDEAPTSTVTSPEVVSTMPTPQTGASPQDLDLAPELQPPRTELGPSNVTPEVRYFFPPSRTVLKMLICVGNNEALLQTLRKPAQDVQRLPLPPPIHFRRTGWVQVTNLQQQARSYRNYVPERTVQRNVPGPVLFASAFLQYSYQWCVERSLTCPRSLRFLATLLPTSSRALSEPYGADVGVLINRWRTAERSRHTQCPMEDRGGEDSLEQRTLRNHKTTARFQSRYGRECDCCSHCPVSS